MKKTTLLSILLASACVSQIASADTLAQWTFESLTLANTPGITPPVNNFAPEVGAGEASGLHASSTTVWSTPVGNGSTKAFSVNTWAVNDYFQFKVSSVNFAGLALSFDQTGSGTGPRDFSLSYSTDGAAFTSFATYAVLVNGTAPNASWGSVTYVPAYNYSFNLSAITALDNAPTVYFRLTDTSTTSASGGTVGTGGTSRVENFTVTATPVSVPEPSPMALVGGFGLLGLVMAARRRSA